MNTTLTAGARPALSIAVIYIIPPDILFGGIMLLVIAREEGEMMHQSQFDPIAMRAAASQACGLLKALANPDRLLVLCQLTHGPLCVSDLETTLGIGQPTLSQQLGVLRDAALVTTRREGKQIYYSIASGAAMAVMQVLYSQYCGASTQSTEGETA